MSDISTELNGVVALVTGSSRGIGKGIAKVLASKGATVYVTGRTLHSVDHPLGGAVVETAAECDALGGRGIPVQIDFADDEQVASLFERIQSESGRLDILVNNAFSLADDLVVDKPFWEKPLSNWQMIDVGVRSSFVCAWHAAKSMAPQGSGLMVQTSGYTGVAYTYGVLFGMAKTAADRMARDMAVELEPFNVASVSLWQGLTMTELAKKNLAEVEGLEGRAATRVSDSSSPEFPGLVIAGLYRDTDKMKLTGGTFITAELAQRYGLVDIDGKEVPSLRNTRGAPVFLPINGGGDQ